MTGFMISYLLTQLFQIVTALEQHLLVCSAMSVSSKRGGARRAAGSSNLSSDEIAQMLGDEARSSGLNFGVYNSILKSCAANGLGLLQNKELLMNIGKVTSGTFTFNPMSDLRPVILALVESKNSLNDSKLNNFLFAGMKATQITTMCTHVRRIASDPVRWQQVTGSLVPVQISSLQEIVKLFSGDCVESDVELEVSPAATRKLKVEVSLDDDGLPCYLSKIGDSAKKSSQQPSSSSKLTSSSSKDSFYIRAMKESDPSFLEEAYHSALALYDPDAAVAAPTKKAKAQRKAKAKAKVKAERKVEEQPKAKAKAKVQPKAKAKGKAQPKANANTIGQPKSKASKIAKEETGSPPANPELDAETAHYPENEKCVYKLEKYRKSNSVGIRRKFGDGKQVFALSSKTCTFEHLVSLGEQVIEMLQSKTEQPGYVLADVEQEALIWGKAQIG